MPLLYVYIVGIRNVIVINDVDHHLEYVKALIELVTICNALCEYIETNIYEMKHMIYIVTCRRIHKPECMAIHL